MSYGRYTQTISWFINNAFQKNRTWNNPIKGVFEIPQIINETCPFSDHIESKNFFVKSVSRQFLEL